MDIPFEADIALARVGDRGAFARLVTATRGLVTTLSLSTVGDVATSEEVAQDVFLAVWRDLATLRNPASFLPWLRQLTRHRALDVARGRRQGPAVARDPDLFADVKDPGPDPQERLVARERAHVLALAFDALPDDAREVLTLYYREGEKVGQVARLLGLRDDTVKKRLSRARAALRDDVLSRFAEAVESSRPADAFTRDVMLAIPLAPPGAMVLAKGALAILLKVASVGAAGLATGFAGAVAVVAGIRKELRGARDERERRALVEIGVVATANVVIFAAAMPLLHTITPAHARALGTLWAAAFMVGHSAIYCVWLPQVKARRRAAEEAADPSTIAQNVRYERMTWAVLAGITVLVVAVWLW